MGLKIFKICAWKNIMKKRLLEKVARIKCSFEVKDGEKIKIEKYEKLNNLTVPCEQKAPSGHI